MAGGAVRCERALLEWLLRNLDEALDYAERLRARAGWDEALDVERLRELLIASRRALRRALYG